MNHEQMDMGYPKINLIELLRGLVKSAVRMLIPGVVPCASEPGGDMFLCIRPARPLR